jgi:hypothetical protein
MVAGSVDTSTGREPLGGSMIDDSVKAGNLLRPTLLSYLQVWTLRWPGGDGISEDDVLSCLPQAMASQVVPCFRELCRLHPELANEIRSFITQTGLPEGSVTPGSDASAND